MWFACQVIGTAKVCMPGLLARFACQVIGTAKVDIWRVLLANIRPALASRAFEQPSAPPQRQWPHLWCRPLRLGPSPPPPAP